MADLYDPFQEALPGLVYFSHRLDLTSKAKAAPTTVQFDIARSPLPNDQIAAAAQSFGASLPGSGWGVGSFMSHLVSTVPDSIAADDLGTIQHKLASSGYLPPHYRPTGQWDSQSQAAFSRWEQDKSDDFYAGHHPLAITTQRGLNALGWMMPSKVFQGIVGAAKGFVQQAPETAERVGALGGAVSGAAIGAAAGSVLPLFGTVAGALGGAAIGAGIGFFGDLLHHDPEEGNQSFDQKLWDALTPYDEYKGKGGAQKFWEDLGWVGTAASLVSGIGSGVGLATKGAAAVAGLADAEGIPFTAAALASPGVEQPGYLGRALSWAVKQGSEERGVAAYDWFKAKGFLAQAERPIIKDIVTPAFTGISSAQFGARMFAGLGSGATETTIEKAIRTAPEPKTGIELPFVGDIVNLPAFVIQPTQFLPWKLGDLSRGLNNIVGSDAAFQPFVNAYRAMVPGSSAEDAHTAVQSMMGRTAPEQASTMTAMHLEHGIESMAMRQVIEEGVEKSSPLYRPLFEAYKNDSREAILQELNGRDLVHSAAQELEGARAASKLAKKPSMLGDLEAAAAPATDMPKLREAMSYAFYDPADRFKGPADFEAYLQRLWGAGSGPESMPNYFDATKMTKEITQKVRVGELVPYEAGAEAPSQHDLGTLLAGGAPGAVPKPMSPGLVQGGAASPVVELKVQAQRLRDDIRESIDLGGQKTQDPAAAVQILSSVKEKQKQLKTLNRQIKALSKRANATWDDKMIVPQRLDTPTNKDFLNMVREHDQLRQVVSTSSDDAQQLGMAKEIYTNWLNTHQDYIPAKMYERALVAAQPTNEIGEHLQKLASTAAEEVALPEDYAALKTLGYKPVVVHARNSFEYAVDPKINEVTGINDFSRRSNFFDSIGLGLGKESDRAIAKLRTVTTERLLDQLSEEKGWGLKGDKLIARLHTGLTEMNYTGVVGNREVRGLKDFGQGARLSHGFIIPEGKGILQARHMAIDIRDLRPDDVFEAMRDLPGFDHSDAADVFAALQQGGAMGVELNFRHPVQTAGQMGRAMKINGFQGFTDLTRQWHAEIPGTEMNKLAFSPKRAVAGAAAGAAFGAYESDDKIKGALKGAGAGLALTLGVEQMLKRDYGFLPDHLYKVATALRYSLSPSFDVRRYVKQNLLAGAMHDLPPIFKAKSYILNRTWPSLLNPTEKVTGDAAWNEALHVLNKVHGVGYMQDLDAFDRTLYAGGITGYSPLLRQAAHAYMLKQRGWSDAKIGAALRDIYSYGTGRTALEKSVNYVFFPFSFEKKLLTAVGDFILQNPGRALLIHEGMRRYNQSETSKDVQKFIQKHVPFLEQLQDFNAFSHGLSPGRFFLQGAVGSPEETHRTNVGKAAQILSNFFVPGGGAVTPIQQFAGGLGDIAKNAFSPVVVTGQSITKLGGRLDKGGSIDQLASLAQQYIPMVKDLNELWDHAYDQVGAIAHGEGRWDQLHDYISSVDDLKDQLQPMALALGYSSVDGFFQSQIGSFFKEKFDSERDDLRNKYPDGFKMTTGFTDTQQIADKALFDIVKDPNPTPAQEHILEVANAVQGFKEMISSTGLDAATFGAIGAQQVRSIGEKYASDPSFNELWTQIFEPQYGPLRMEAV